MSSPADGGSKPNHEDEQQRRHRERHHYDPARPVLKNVSFTAAPGQLIWWARVAAASPRSSR